MKIKLLKPWGSNPAGTIVEPSPQDVAHILIRRGIAEEVKDTEGIRPAGSRRSIKKAEANA